MLARKSMASGGYSIVENVQALASEKLDQVPARYIRAETQLDLLLVDQSLHVPVIDFGKLVADDGESANIEELAKLHLACKDWSFYQVINHGISVEVIEKMKRDMKEFFELPLEDKLAYAREPSSIEGYGQGFIVTEDQKLDWGDMFFVISHPVKLRNDRFWPTAPSTFRKGTRIFLKHLESNTCARETMDQYSKEVQGLAEMLLRLMGRNLGLDPEMLSSLFVGGVQSLRMNYYPPCKEADKVMGRTPHTDSTGLTLLVQANEVSGLQIRRAGKWVPIKPVQGAIIVNIGDIFEIMSNGEYKSVEHRVVVNPKNERMSIAAFHSPSMSAMVGPISGLLTVTGTKYDTVSYEEYMKMVMARKLAGKGMISSSEGRYSMNF